MTADAFRRLALSLPETVEQQHMNHPDFRVAGRIFATLGHPDARSGMVSLTPELQQQFVEAAPEVFKPVKGGWGLRGATSVFLPAATQAAVRPAMEAAHQLTALKGLKPSARRRKKRP
jgi:YjbR